MSQKDDIREKVSEAYARAVTQPAEGCSCCGSVPKGVAAKLAGYTGEELAALPPEAVQNAFGCGNPLAFAEVRRGDVVLDLGSGAGVDILLAAKKVGPKGRVIGVDMTDEMIAKARENIAAAGLTNVEVRKGIIEKLPVETASVDFVISNCVINLSPDKPKVFAEIFRVLKPGARMSVSDMVVEELPDEARRSQALYDTCIAGAISEEEYVAGLKRAGLEQVEVRERFVYDAVQLEALIRSELPDNEQVMSCCGSIDAAALGARMVGKIWSAKFQARKPLGK